ncbi:MAG: response regulator [Candidatus Krumholzibacteria bacterium]|nr:response regulator [Candidatus Krumholzibacteria bacterium]
MHILLVEDSEDNRLLIQAFIKKPPATIDTAENGAIAVDKFKNGKYDLVLMDMQMPVMDGYTATRKIREWEQEKNRIHLAGGECHGKRRKDHRPH